MPDHNTSRSDAVAQGAALPTPHDTLMSPEILPDRRVTFRTNGACRLSEILTRRGIHHTFNETVGEYTWINWRQYLYEFVQLLFRD
jgi:enterochelin esterase-like enzyme